MIVFDGVEIKGSVCKLTWYRIYLEYDQDYDTPRESFKNCALFIALYTQRRERHPLSIKYL